MIKDPESLEAARNAWLERQEALLSEALDQPYPISRYDREKIDLLRRNKDRALERLSQVRNNLTASPSRRLHAVLALRHLEVSVDPAELIEIAAASADTTLELLLELSHGTPLSEPLPTAFEAFVVQAIAHPDGRVQDSALQLITLRGLASAGDALWAQIEAEAAPSAALLRAAARVHPTPELIELLLPRLKPLDPLPLSDESVFGALSLVAQHASDAELRSRAVDLCVDFIVAQEDLRWLDSFTLDAIAAIAAVQPAERARRLLLRIVSEGRWRIAREDALRHIALVDTKLARELAVKFTLELETSAEPPTRATADNSLEDLARKCVELGVLTQAEAGSALAMSGGADASAESTQVLSLLMHAKRMLCFDVEGGSVPVRHDRLLAWFADASAGRFRPEVAREDYVPASDIEGRGTYLVEFIHDGRLYRIHPQDLGDWYDVDALVAAIHRALSDADVPERFVALADRGQWAGFVFGEPNLLKKAAPALGLPLAPD